MSINPYKPFDSFPESIPTPVVPSFMSGPTADRPVASPAHLNWFYFDTTTSTLYACTFDTAFAWTQMSAAPTGFVRFVSVPASTGSTGSPGDFSVDANFYYICHDTDTWYRYIKGAIF